MEQRRFDVCTRIINCVINKIFNICVKLLRE